eukprot:COSAG04_NODE_18089_length_451_cov_0.880682_1_plen_86_part_01
MACKWQMQQLAESEVRSGRGIAASRGDGASAAKCPLAYLMLIDHSPARLLQPLGRPVPSPTLTPPSDPRASNGKAVRSAGSGRQRR